MNPYIPEKLPIDLSTLNWQKITSKVSEASAELAFYNGILKAIINPTIFLTPLETKEAVLSSLIEGTVTTVDEVLKFEADIKPENINKQNDIIEVINYRKATRHANAWLKKELPLNSTFICAIQKDLMQGARGKDRHPGEIRKEQVWIGPKGCSIKDASYVPPEPLGLQPLLDNLVSYINSPNQEILMQTAIMHAQFEILHPFCDGNGRTGRILIPLFLWCKKRISSPMFYISEYFNENRDEYIENLRKISAEHNWERWILFFLEAIRVQAMRNSEKANQVLNLYNKMRSMIADLTRSPYAMKVLDTLFITPVVRPPIFIKLSRIESQSAYRIIAKLKSAGILKQIKEHSGRKSEVLIFDELFQLIR
jgi:Fic family protein